MKKIFFLFATLLSFFTAKASHVPGGNITYECLGGNTFLVTLTLYEDCGTAFISFGSETITATNDCGLPNQSIVCNQIVFQQEISQLCPADASNSECFPTGFLPGVYMHKYQGTVTLPGTCDAWHFAFSDCCRNFANNSSASDDYYFQADLYSSTAPCNNSAQLTAQPIPYVCAGQPVNYGFGATDPDGDSLVYSLVNALRAAGTSITYTVGFSGAAPIPGITIDPATGILNFTTSVTGNYIVAVLIQEYNAAGQLTGTITQDFQFEVITCTNNTPAAPDSVTNFTGSGVQINSNTINLCSGQTACFDMVFSDPDLSQNLSVDTALSLFPPGVTYSITGTNPMTVHVCVVATPGVATYSVLSLLVEDDACPINAFANYAVSIGIAESAIPLNILQEIDPPCAGINTGLIEVEAPASIPLTFEWYLASDTINPVFVDSLNNPSTFSGLGPGSYLVLFEDTAGCVSYEYIDLTGSIPHFDNVVINNSACPGVNSGSISAEAINGTDPWQYIWESTGVGADTILHQTGITGAGNLTGIDGGLYSLTIVDSNGCSNDTLITVSTNLEPTLTINSITAASCPEVNNGTIAVSASGGSLPWDYLYETTGPPTTTVQSVIDLAATSNSVDSLEAGTYTITITDADGCTADTTITVTAGTFTGTGTATPEICFDYDNGTVTLSHISGGNAPYSFILTDNAGLPLDTSSTGVFNPMATGTYGGYIIDANGCIDTISSLTVNQAAFLNAAFTVSPDFGDPPMVSVIEDFSTGALTYVWVIENNPENDTILGYTGVFPYTFDEEGLFNVTLYVFDANGCSDTAMHVVDLAYSSMVFPNIITPGSGDTLNNYLEFASRKIDAFQCKVYDRWGKLMFESTDPSMKWDATLNGKPCADGNYFYYVKATGRDNKEYDYHGSLQIIRK